MLKILLLCIFMQIFVFETEAELLSYPKYSNRYLSKKSMMGLGKVGARFIPDEFKSEPARLPKNDAKLKNSISKNMDSLMSTPNPTNYWLNSVGTINGDTDGTWWPLSTTTQSPYGQCTDTASFCSQYANSCHDPNYLPFLCTECNATCGLCDDIGQAICSQYTGTSTPPARNCYDTSNDCYEYTNLCSIPAYRSQMCQYCQSSCGLCYDPSCSNDGFKKFLKIK